MRKKTKKTQATKLFGGKGLFNPIKIKKKKQTKVLSRKMRIGL